MRAVLKALTVAVLAALFLAVVLFTAPAFGQSKFPGQSTFSEETAMDLLVLELGAWQFACRHTKTNCRDIPKPRVAYALLPYQYGAFDLGSRTVLIDLRLLGQPLATVVMVHEMTHYLQDKRYPLRTVVPIPEGCRDEKEAHEAAVAFVAKTGIAKGDPRVREWKDAARGYGCNEDGSPVIPSLVQPE